MKVKFIKTQTQESDKGKTIKLSFAGMLNDMIYKLSIDGYENDIAAFMKENRLKAYGEMLDLDLENQQQQL